MLIVNACLEGRAFDIIIDTNSPRIFVEIGRIKSA